METEPELLLETRNTHFIAAANPKTNVRRPSAVISVPLIFRENKKRSILLCVVAVFRRYLLAKARLLSSLHRTKSGVKKFNGDGTSFHHIVDAVDALIVLLEIHVRQRHTFFPNLKPRSD
jgi:hypothetical protein